MREEAEGNELIHLKLLTEILGSLRKFRQT
jgi:hypothetical protein